MPQVNFVTLNIARDTKKKKKVNSKRIEFHNFCEIYYLQS